MKYDLEVRLKWRNLTGILWHRPSGYQEGKWTVIYSRLKLLPSMHCVAVRAGISWYYQTSFYIVFLFLCLNHSNFVQKSMKLIQLIVEDTDDHLLQSDTNWYLRQGNCKSQKASLAVFTCSVATCVTCGERKHQVPGEVKESMANNYRNASLVTHRWGYKQECLRAWLW